jgi:hypothetical protein
MEKTMKSKQIILVVGVVLTCILLVSVRGTKTVEGAASDRDVLEMMRNVNTMEASAFLKSQRYMSAIELLQGGGPVRTDKSVHSDIQIHDAASATVRDLNLTIVTSEDRKHYQVALVRAAQECSTAYFSNESGVIYTAKALGCD